MQKKKEKFLNKIVKRNYNNELEIVLENKKFDENAKNILLSTLYKIETGYPDYEQVKRNVLPKKQFIEMIINIIKNNIDEMEIVKINSEEAKVLKGKKCKIYKKEKKIICYPIEMVVLNAILEISKQDKIIKDNYYVLNKTLSDLINTGNNINAVETIRDFNGFSWDIVTKDIESFEYNLIYQNLRITVGEEFLNKWIYNSEIILDYYDMFKNLLDDKYGSKNGKKFITNIAKISVLLETIYNKKYANTLIKEKREIEEELKKISDKEKFTKKLTKEKKELNEQIKEIDKTINDKELLEIEYRKRNLKLPLEKKIFSMKVLKKILKEERRKLEKEREKINKILNPSEFVKYSKELDAKYEYLKYAEVDDINKEISSQILNIQKNFLDFIKIDIQNATTKEQVLNIIVSLRYYINIFVAQGVKIIQIKQLQKSIAEIIQLLANKAVETKAVTQVSKKVELNYVILSVILSSKIINLQNINIKISNENEKEILSIYDENVFDKNIELKDINEKELLIKTNKIIKLFV